MSSTKMQGIKAHYNFYFKVCEINQERYLLDARKWDQIHTALNIMLIVINAISTVLAVIEGSLPMYVVPIFTGVATILSSTLGVLRPFQKRQDSQNTSKQFRNAKYNLISSENMDDFKEARKQIFDAMNERPLASFDTEKNLKRHLQEHDNTEDTDHFIESSITENFQMELDKLDRKYKKHVQNLQTEDESLEDETNEQSRVLKDENASVVR